MAAATVFHLSLRAAALLVLLALGASASAAPLFYRAVPSDSNVSTSFSTTAAFDVNPDFTEVVPGGNEFPTFFVLSGQSNTFASPQSTLDADVGLPGNFDDGANGIDFSTLVVHFPNVPGTLTGSGIIPVPLDVTGSPVQSLLFNATVSELRITLDDPFSSSLTPTGNPNEWLWAGLANVTISGELQPAVNVPTVDPLPLGVTPFSQAAAIPLVGTFSGDSAGTQVTVGFEVGALENLDLGLPPVSESFDIGDLGLVTGFLDLNALVLQQLTGAVVYRNSLVPIPEPGTGALLLLGLAGLAARRRTMR